MLKKFLALLLILFTGCTSMEKSEVKVIKKTEIKEIEKSKNESEKKFVAVVIPFNNETGNIEYDKIILNGVERLTRTIDDNKRFELIEREKVEKVIEENELILTGRGKQEAINKIGEALNADMAIITRVSKVSYLEKKNMSREILEMTQESSVTIEMRAVLVKTGKVISTATVEKKYINKYKKTEESIENKHLENEFMFEKVFEEAIAEAGDRVSKKIPLKK